MNEIDARLLRAIGREITEKMAPELTYPGAADRVALADKALDYLAGILDLLPGISAAAIQNLRGALGATFGSLPQTAAFAAVAELRGRYDAMVPSPDGGGEQEILALRGLGAEVIRRLADIPLAGLNFRESDFVRGCCAAIGDADGAWVARFDRARKERAEAKSPAASAGPVAAAPEQLTPESMTAYLRRQFPNSPSIRVTRVTLIPGGRSKRTIALSLENSGELPGELVMRQDMPLKHVGSRIADEYAPLAKLHQLGLPVPQILHFQPGETELGQGFLLMPFLRGKPPGDYFGLTESCPGAYADFARALARLHRTDAAALGLAPVDTNTDPLRRHIDAQWAIWRHSLRPSAIVDYAFFFAARECDETAGSWSAVHGDCGPHNMLVENDRLTAILDWEFAHAGDPAEDLGITRIYVEQAMPWAEFLAIYREAGGPDIPDRRIRAAMLGHYLKGAALSANSTRNFAEGATDDFIKGMISFTGLPQIEMKLVGLMADK